MSKAFLFPGQGSQVIGMGKALAEESAAARLIFNEVDDALGDSLSKLMWEGAQDDLTLTENAQPALMATSLAALRFLEERLGGEALWQDVTLVAGHSLGEYSALTAAGAFSVADAARLLRLRGQAMQSAVPAGEGAMAALIGLEHETVAQILTEVGAFGVCDIANDNGGGQIVLSGAKRAVEEAIALASARGARRALMLDVSAPFHCRLMEPAAERMREALSSIAINKPRVAVLANVTAALSDEPETIRQTLVAQVAGTVRWAESMSRLRQLGITRAWELGAGKVLAGLLRRIDKDLPVGSFGSPEALPSLLD